MRGHIAKKGSRYYVVIYEGVDSSKGKPKRRWHAAGETRAEAEKLLAELVKRVHDGDYRAPDKITVGDYLLHRWLPAKQTRLKPTTAGVYERNIRLHTNPNIGRILLQKLQLEDLDGLYAKLLHDGKRNGKDGGLSARSVRAVHTTIQSAPSDAARKGTVVRNVADLADPPAAGRSEQAMSVWTSDELRCFLEAIAGHDLYLLYLLAATTGMRRGELAGLTWRNVDLDAARLTVNRQADPVGRLQHHREQPQVRHEPAHHRPRSAHRRRTAPPPPEPTRTAHGHRASQRRRLRVRQARRLTRPPGLHQPDLPACRDQARCAPHPLPRPAPHPRPHPAATRGQRQGGQRAPRPQQRRVHHDRLSTRHARHASPSRSHLRRRRLRRASGALVNGPRSVRSGLVGVLIRGPTRGVVKEVYPDYNASAPLDERVVESTVPFSSGRSSG